MKRSQPAPTLGLTLALITLKEKSLENYRDHQTDCGTSCNFGNGGGAGFGPAYFGLSPQGGGSAA